MNTSIKTSKNQTIIIPSPRLPRQRKESMARAQLEPIPKYSSKNKIKSQASQSRYDVPDAFLNNGTEKKIDSVINQPPNAAQMEKI
jgi:hypothetical protein